MTGGPPPLLWESVEFWLVDFALIAPCVIALVTWRKDEVQRAFLLRRVVLGAAALAVVAHLALAWDAWEGLAGRPRVVGAGASAWGPEQIVVDALVGSVVAIVVLAYTVGLAAIFRRPPSGALGLPWRGLALFGAVLAAGWFARLQAPSRPGLSFTGRTVWPTVPPFGRRWDWDQVDWLGCAGGVGGVASLLAVAVVLLIGIEVLSTRRRASPERREAQREGLLFWGFLLLAGAVLFLEVKAVDFVGTARARAPGSSVWTREFPAWLVDHSVLLVLALAGFVAACFGGLHLARREKAADAAAA